MRTTIVGGRPPGSGTRGGPIPRGIEVLVIKAAVDPSFRERLLEDPQGAAQSIGLELSTLERAMLRAVPSQHLAGIIGNVKVAPHLLPAFLGRAAALMLAALTPGLTSGCESHNDEAIATTSAPVTALTNAAPATATLAPTHLPEPGVTANARVVAPSTDSSLPSSTVSPPVPEQSPTQRVTRGIRPDRPSVLPRPGSNR